MPIIRQFEDIAEGTFWKHNKTDDLFRIALITGDNHFVRNPTITIERRTDAKTFTVTADQLRNLYHEFDIDAEPPTRCTGCEVCLFEGDGSCEDRPRKLTPGKTSIEAVIDPIRPVRRRKGRPVKPRRDIDSYFSK